VTAVTPVATALDSVRWKPSARSRSLSGISALSAPPARILARSATPLRREPASPFQSARDEICGVGYQTFYVETALCNQIFPGGLKGRGALAANA